MKLLIITAIAAFEKDIKKMLQQAEVKSFSYQDVKGYKDHSEEGVETNWFGTELNETDSLLFYAFVKKDNVDLLFDLVSGFNEKQETESNIHVAVVNIENSN
jgi:nitrogen regulatory protein PII